jgi:signal transduction histidine kinase
MLPPFQKHLWVALGVVLLLFVGMAALAYKSTTGFVEAASHVARSHQIRSTFERMGTLLHDIDRSHHAYVLSGEVFLLEPYNAATSRIADNMKQARALTKDRPRDQERLDRLDKLIASRLSAAGKAVDLQRVQDFTAARALIQSDQRSEEMEQIHQIITEALDEEEREIARHSQRHTALAESTMIFVGGGSLIVLAFVLGAVLIYRLSYTNRQKSKIALQVSEANLHASYNRLRTLTKQLELVREEESARIAREIHDELGQALTSAKLDLAWVAKHVASSQNEKTADDVRARILDLMQTVETTIRSVRDIATALRPPILDDLGLGPAIDWLTRDFEKRTGIRSHCSIPTDPIPVGPEHATRLFRIVQEALTNVARHAQATSVYVRLTVSAGEIHVEVSDNGRGITEQELTSNLSVGLMGMRERAEMGNGALTIDGTLGKGTTVTVQIPLMGGVE